MWSESSESQPVEITNAFLQHLVWKHLRFATCDSHVMTAIWNLIFISTKEWKHPSPCHYNPDVTGFTLINTFKWVVHHQIKWGLSQSGTLSTHSTGRNVTPSEAQFPFWFMPCRAFAPFVRAHSWLPGGGHLMAGPSGRHLFLRFADYILLHTSDPSPLIKLQKWTSESFRGEYLQQVNWLYLLCPHIWGGHIGWLEGAIRKGRQKRLL